MLTDIWEYIHEDAEGHSIHIGPYEVRGAAKTGLATRARVVPGKSRRMFGLILLVKVDMM